MLPSEKTNVCIELFVLVPFFQSPISQDDETALMRGYAAAMDASMTQEPLCAAPEAPPLELEIPEPQEGPSGSPARGGELSAVQDPDTETQSQLSLCVSESGTVKKSKGKEEDSPVPSWGFFLWIVLSVKHDHCKSHQMLNVL